MFAHAGVDLNYLLEALEAERRHSETLEAERDAARKNLADLENEVEDLLDRVQDRDNRISLLEEALANAGGRLALRGDPA
jgi:Skp family chaperone for outer membrane proteins